MSSDGRKHLLHLTVGKKESEQRGTGFFRNLFERRIRAPTTVTSDGAPGLINAICVGSAGGCEAGQRVKHECASPSELFQHFGAQSAPSMGRVLPVGVTVCI
jgi:hypothetical protein